MTTEVWTSTRNQISEATRITLQEALEEENRKDTPSFGSEDYDEIHRSGTGQGSLASTTSQVQYMPRTDQTTRGSWEPFFSNWMNIGEAAAN